jgi:hypothetical protein
MRLFHKLDTEAKEWTERGGSKTWENWHEIWIHTSHFVVRRRRRYGVSLISFEFDCTCRVCFSLKRTLPIIALCKPTSSSLDLLLPTLLLPPPWVCCTLYHDESVETYASLDREGAEPMRAVQLVSDGLRNRFKCLTANAQEIEENYPKRCSKRRLKLWEKIRRTRARRRSSKRRQNERTKERNWAPTELPNPDKTCSLIP